MTIKRSVLVAGLLNLLVPPLGFVYVGKLAYAGAFLVGFVLWFTVSSWTRAVFLPFGVLALLAILIGLWIGSIVLAGILADRQGFVTERRWYLYVAFFVMSWLIVTILMANRVYETYHIASGSLMPTLLVGDDILVDTTAYDTKALKGPSRGDMVVFRFPEDPATPWVMRVVGIPGDEIGYYDKILHINGKPVELTELDTYQGVGSGVFMTGASVYEERLEGAAYKILVQRGRPSVKGKYVVPTNHYFVLGDNRDNSRDSRYWGTVPRENLIGKVVLVWMNWDRGHGINYSRFGVPIQ